MQINFTKMHGLGNDFVVIDAINQPIDLNPDQFRYIANRRLGIGCDQILLVESSPREGIEFRYRIFNADGGEVEQCGNGARCFARFVIDKGLSDSKVIRVETESGIIDLSMTTDGNVRVDMGTPVLEPSLIPFMADEQACEYQLQVDDQHISIGAVSMGNPHAVIRVEELASAPVHSLGARIEQHSRFPQRVNVGFMQLIDREHINLRVWERGVGETLACGTGACAAVVSGILRGWLGPRVVVNLQEGQLVIEWHGDNQSVLMTGPATSVFEGTIQI